MPSRSRPPDGPSSQVQEEVAPTGHSVPEPVRRLLSRPRDIRAVRAVVAPVTGLDTCDGDSKCRAFLDLRKSLPRSVLQATADEVGRMATEDGWPASRFAEEVMYAVLRAAEEGAPGVRRLGPARHVNGVTLQSTPFGRIPDPETLRQSPSGPQSGES